MSEGRRMCSRQWARAISRGVALAGLILACLVVLAESVDRLVFRSKTFKARKTHEFEEGLGSIEVLILGQSDIEVAIIPSYLDAPTYNLAGRGETIIETWFKLQTYINRMPNLKVVVVSVALARFSSNGRHRFGDHSLREYVSLEDLPEIYALFGPAMVRRKILFALPILERQAFRAFLRNLRKIIRGEPIASSTLLDGYRMMTGSYAAESDKRRLDKIMRLQFHGKNQFDEKMVEHFKKILLLCRRHNVKVLTVSSPMTDAYLESSRQYVTEDVLRQTIPDNPEFAALIQFHMDYIDLWPARHELFANVNHLNHVGAKAFSEVFAADIAEALKQQSSVISRQ